MSFAAGTGVSFAALAAARNPHVGIAMQTLEETARAHGGRLPRLVVEALTANGHADVAARFADRFERRGCLHGTSSGVMERVPARVEAERTHGPTPLRAEDLRVQVDARTREPYWTDAFGAPVRDERLPAPIPGHRLEDDGAGGFRYRGSAVAAAILDDA